MVQSRVEEGDRIKKMKPEERLKLLKKTLKKSNALTEKLLERLDREWDDIYQEDSENGMPRYILMISLYLVFTCRH